MKECFWLAALAGLSLSCATVVRPGPGEIHPDAKQRLSKQQDDAEAEALTRALQSAEAAPEDLRAQRKAVQLATERLSRSRKDGKQAVYEAALPAVRRLEQHPESCTVRLEAGKVHSLARETEQAAQNFVASVETCRSLAGLRSASYALKDLKRCRELVKLAEQVWPTTEQSQWVHLMDSVNVCSDSVSLRRNLAFVPNDVVEEYFGLLAARAQEQRRSNCRAHCAQSRSNCEAACWNASSCYASCASRASACMASCS